MFLTKDKSSKYYQVVYFVNGKRTKKSTKRTTKAEALKFLFTFNPDETEIDEEEPKQKKILISHFKDEYFDYVSKSKSSHYLESINLSFNQFINFSKDLPLTRINNRLVDKFIVSVFSRSKYAAALYYGTLKAAFSKAVDWNYIELNPFKKVKMPKIPKRHPLFITKEELQLIIDNTDRKFLRNIFYTGFYTGMRLAEILNMKWSWINFKNDIITVKCTDDFLTKSRKERDITLHPVLRPKLLSQLPKIIDINQDDFVFMKVKGVRFNEDFISKQFKKSVRAAGLNDEIHFHTLRHSFASNMVQKGADLYRVKVLLGHEDLKTTQIYSHLQQENLRDAVNLL